MNIMCIKEILPNLEILQNYQRRMKMAITGFTFMPLESGLRQELQMQDILILLKP